MLSLYHIAGVNYRSRQIDHEAQSIMRRCDLTSRGLPLKVSADGSCLFNAISVLIGGSEAMAHELRALISREMIHHRDHYRMLPEASDIELVSPPLEEAIDDCLCPDGFSSAFTIHAGPGKRDTSGHRCDIPSHERYKYKTAFLYNLDRPVYMHICMHCNKAACHIPSNQEHYTVLYQAQHAPCMCFSQVFSMQCTGRSTPPTDRRVSRSCMLITRQLYASCGPESGHLQPCKRVEKTGCSCQTTLCHLCPSETTIEKKRYTCHVIAITCTCIRIQYRALRNCLPPCPWMAVTLTAVIFRSAHNLKQVSHYIIFGGVNKLISCSFIR